MSVTVTKEKLEKLKALATNNPNKNEGEVAQRLYDKLKDRAIKEGIIDVSGLEVTDDEVALAKKFGIVDYQITESKDGISVTASHQDPGTAIEFALVTHLMRRKAKRAEAKRLEEEKKKLEDKKALSEGYGEEPIGNNM